MSLPEDRIQRHGSARPGHEDRLRWDERYRAGACPGGGEISAWVRSQARYLHGGRALDVACGAGRHTFWLVELGYQVDAVDISLEGLRRLVEEAKERGIGEAVHIIQADLNSWRPQVDCYDLVLVARYLNRNLWPDLKAALKRGGLLLHRTFHSDVLYERPEFNRAHLLQPGELLSAFSQWPLLAYEEQRWCANGEWRDCTSSILVRKP